MLKRLLCAASVLILCAGLALAQTPADTPPAPGQLTPHMLGELLRAATTFHELVQNLNAGKLLGPDQHVVGPDGQLHHSTDRTAQTVGAGAGAGAAIGAMTHKQNGVMIGALIGAGGGIIVDQIIKTREEQRARAASAPASNIGDARQDRPRDFRAR